MTTEGKSIDELERFCGYQPLNAAIRIKELESRLDSLRQNLAVAHSILNDAMAEQDYHVDVSRTAVWLAANEGVVEIPFRIDSPEAEQRFRDAMDVPFGPGKCPRCGFSDSPSGEVCGPCKKYMALSE